MKNENTNEFLPDNYEVPESAGNYMKFKPGENRFRILASPTMGWVYWVDEDGNPRPAGAKPQKGDKPVRKRMNEDVPVGAADTVKHFWAVPVVNYATNQIQVLEITQKGIQNAVRNLSRNKGWGSPTGYDLAVTRTGEGLETEYSILPEPKTELEADLQTEWNNLVAAGFDMERLFDGGHPHPQSGSQPKEGKDSSLKAPKAEAKAEAEADEINLDDIPF